MYNLEKTRKEIDEIDKELLPLFLRRIKCSEDVARYKIENSMPIYNKAREDEILQNIRENSGDMADYAAAFFTSLMNISKVRQQEIFGSNSFEELEFDTLNIENPRVSCQGVEGAYSHKATLELYKDAKINFCSSFESVFKDIEDNVSDFGVVPVENSEAGSVAEVYSLILKYRYYIVSAINLSVNHCLACKKGSNIETVISHPQALMQCANYIDLKGFNSKNFSNTALSAKFVSESNDMTIATICSVDAANEFGLEIIEENIQDNKENQTRFIGISKKPSISEKADIISLCFALPNETGSLYRVLERFSAIGLNLCKLESRTIKGKSFEYDFYLDFKGSIKDRHVALLLSDLQKELKRFSFLGNYSLEIK